MINKFATFLTKIFLDSEIISEKEVSIYYFGIYQSITFVINVISMLIIMVTMNMIYEGIVFSLSYSILRSFAGGIHSKSSVRCYFFSVSLMIGNMMIVNEFFSRKKILLLLGIVSSIVVFAFSPVDTKNRKLKDIEKIIYRIKTKRILGIELIIASVFYFINAERLFASIILSIISVAFMLCLGKIDNISKNVPD